MCLFVCMDICPHGLSVCLPEYMPVACLSESVCVPDGLSVCLYIHQSGCLTAELYNIFLNVYYVYLSLSCRSPNLCLSDSSTSSCHTCYDVPYAVLYYVSVSPTPQTLRSILAGAKRKKNIISLYPSSRQFPPCPSYRFYKQAPLDFSHLPSTKLP
jgi:hypothetical protein